MMMTKDKSRPYLVASVDEVSDATGWYDTGWDGGFEEKKVAPPRVSRPSQAKVDSRERDARIHALAIQADEPAWHHHHRLDAILAARNPVYEASKPLLRTLAKLPDTTFSSYTQIETFRRMMEREISHFQELCKKAKIDQREMTTISFCLCTAIDEVASYTSWGGGATPGEIGPWASDMLSETFHGDLNGGVEFYLLIGATAGSDNPEEHIDLLEVMYHILSIGFEGQYRYSAQGQENITEVRTALYDLINQQRPPRSTRMSPTILVEREAKYAALRRFPVWGSALIMSVIVLSSFSWTKYQLVQRTSQVVKEIDAIGNMGETTARPASTTTSIKIQNGITENI